MLKNLLVGGVDSRGRGSRALEHTVSADGSALIRRPQQGGGRDIGGQDLGIRRVADVARPVPVAHPDTGTQVAAVSGVELGDVLSTGYFSFGLSAQSAAQCFAPQRQLTERPYVGASS